MLKENKQLESEMAESNNKSAKALLWFSGIIIFLGFNAENHAGLGVAGLFLFSLAAIFSTLALFLGSNQTKIMSLFVIVITVLFAIKSYSVYEHRMDRYYASAVRSDLKNLCVAEEANFADHKTYSTDMEIHTSKDVTIEIVRADKNYFEAEGTHFELNDTYWIKSGTDSSCRLYRQEEGSSKLNKL